MRYARKRDANERDIIMVLETAGCDVLQGLDVDLIVGRAGRNFLLEIKCVGSLERLRPVQKRLRATWRGQYAIVQTAEEALAVIGG